MLWPVSLLLLWVWVLSLKGSQGLGLEKYAIIKTAERHLQTTELVRAVNGIVVSLISLHAWTGECSNEYTAIANNIYMCT